MGTVYGAFQIAVCFIFALSALLKMRDIPAFAETALDYKVIPRRLTIVYAWTMPFAELAGGVLVLFSPTARYGALLNILLLASFAYAVAAVIRAKRDISCGCYGKWLESRADAFTLGKIAALIAICAVLAAVSPAEESYSRAAAVALGLLLALLYFGMQMLWNFYQENAKIFS